MTVPVGPGSLFPGRLLKWQMSYNICMQGRPTRDIKLYICTTQLAHDLSTSQHAHLTDHGTQDLRQLLERCWATKDRPRHLPIRPGPVSIMYYHDSASDLGKQRTNSGRVVLKLKSLVTHLQKLHGTCRVIVERRRKGSRCAVSIQAFRRR